LPCPTFKRLKLDLRTPENKNLFLTNERNSEDRSRSSSEKRSQKLEKGVKNEKNKKEKKTGDRRSLKERSPGSPRFGKI
jgi:hypothetical protein